MDESREATVPNLGHSLRKQTQFPEAVHWYVLVCLPPTLIKYNLILSNSTERNNKKTDKVVQVTRWSRLPATLGNSLDVNAIPYVIRPMMYSFATPDPHRFRSQKLVE